jgi:dipeptide/tripeptide permease
MFLTNGLKFQKYTFTLTVLITVVAVAIFSRNIDKNDIFNDPKNKISIAFLVISVFALYYILARGGTEKAITNRFKLK